MPSRKLPLQIRRQPSKPYTPFMVAVPASLTGTRRVRKFFASEADAAAFIARIYSIGYEGAFKPQPSAKSQTPPSRSPQPPTAPPQTAPSTTPPSRTSPSQDPTAAPPTAAPPVPAGPLLTEMTARYRLHIAPRLKPRPMAQIRLVCSALDARFPSSPIRSITHADLAAWLASAPGGPVHKRNLHRVARRIFEHACIWEEAIERNPFDRIPAPSGDRQPPHVLSPADFHASLHATDDPAMLPLLAWLAIGGYAGLRTCEIQSAMWADIGEEIHVAQPKRTSRGLRPRYVEILPPLAVLLPFLRPPTGGPIIPWSDRDFRILYLPRLVRALRWTRWPHNSLRHSFCTYHAAASVWWSTEIPTAIANKLASPIKTPSRNRRTCNTLCPP